MKTIADLNALIPTLVKLLHAYEQNSGGTYADEDENGCCTTREWAENSREYLEDGWEIYFWYELNERKHDATGRITDMSVCHYDEATEELTDFDGDDLNELWLALDKELVSI